MSLRYEGEGLVYDGAAFLSASSDFRAMIPVLAESLPAPFAAAVLVSLPDMVDSAVSECEALRVALAERDAWIVQALVVFESGREHFERAGLGAPP